MRWSPRFSRFLVLAASLVCAAQAGADDRSDYRIDLTKSVRWDRFELKATTVFNFAAAGLKLPGCRSQAEELADLEFPRLVLPTLFSLRVDSSSTVADLIEEGIVSLEDIQNLASSARRSASVLSGDLLTITSGYEIDLKTFASSLIRHRHIAEPPRPLQPRSTKTYTGIVVFAIDSLPVHGTARSSSASACFFPKIWDSGMNLVYERNMVDPEAARRWGIVRYADASDPALSTSALADRVGEDPLRIFASGLFGIFSTDLVVDSDDALRILSSEANRRLLKEGRVVIVLGADAVRALP